MLGRRLDCMELEDRTLFNAAPLAAGLGNPGPSASNVASPQNVLPPADAQVVNVVLIDSTLANSNQLAQAALAGDKVILYDGAHQSASQVLSEVVTWAQSSGERIGELAILSHGVGGTFELGNQWITTTSLSETSAAWQQLGSVLAERADIELFGCGVAVPGSSGQALIDQLSTLTGAQVYASTNVTGQGGDWTLEAASAGANPLLSASDVPLDSAALLNYDGTLATIAIDTTSSAATASGGSSNLTFAHTVNSVGDPILIVDIAVAHGGGSDPVTSVTYGGQSLTLAASANTPNTQSADIWYLLGPTVGTANVTINLSSSSNVVASATDYFGVNQATPFGLSATATGTAGSSPSVTVVSLLGQVVVDSLAVQGNSLSIAPSASGETQLWSQATGTTASDVLGGGSSAPGGLLTTMSWTETANHNWALAAIPLLADVLPVDQAPTITVPAAQATSDTSTLTFNSGNGNAITVADSDSGGNAEQVTLSVASGTLTLGGMAGLTVTAGANGSASMTVQGTLAKLDAALNGLTYTPPSNLTNSGSDTLSIVANDLGNSGLGGPLTASSTVNIAITHVDRAPVNTIPAAQSVNDNTTLVFSSGNGNQLSVADSDANGSVEQVALTVGSGTLNLSGTSGLTFIAGSNGSASMTVQGTLANIDAALGGLIYAPPAGLTNNSSDTLSLFANDLGNTGLGGPLTATSTVGIVVNHVDQAPLNTIPGAQAVNDNTTLVFSSGNGNQLSVADSDANGSVEQVALTVGCGTLNLSGTSGLTFTAGSNGSAAMTIQGTLANINAALNGLIYAPPANLTNSSSDTLSLVANDLGNTGLGGPLTATSTVAITLDHVDLAPVNAVPGALSVNDNATLVFSSANGNQISVSDADANGNPEQIALAVGSGTLTFSGTAGLTFTAGSNGSSSLTVQGTLANLDAALNGLTYSPPANLTNNGSDTLSLTVNDLGNAGLGGPLTATSTIAITLDHVDLAPVNTVPGAQGVYDNATLIFSSAAGNQISVADADANGSPEQIVLAVGSGTLTFSGTTGLTFTAGSNGSNSLTVQGTLANLDAALNGLTYTPPANQFNGSSDTLSLVASDLGNTGLGGPIITNSSVNIAINHLDVAPVDSAPASQTTWLNTPLVFSTAGGNAISIADRDAGGNAEQVALAVNSGTLTLGGTAGLTFTAGSSGSASLTIQGTLANLNAALNGLTYTPATNYVGTASLQIVANDLGNSGVGGSQTATTQVNITVNDGAPTLVVPASQISKNVGLVFSSATGNPIVVGTSGSPSDVLGVMLTATNGTVTLASTSGLTFTNGNGQNNATMSFSGTVSAINAALNGMTFQTAAYSDSLQIAATNLAGPGGTPITVTANVAIAQTPLIAPPVSTSIALSQPSPLHSVATISTVVQPAAPSIVLPAALQSVAPPSAQSPAARFAAPPPMAMPSQAETRLPAASLAVGDPSSFDPLTAQAQPHSIGGSRARVVREFAGLYAATHQVLTDDLDNVRRQFQATLHSQVFVIGSALTVSTSLSVGYVMWMLRSGMLISSIIAQLPAWQLMDPLVILSRMDGSDGGKSSDDDDESLQSILEASPYGKAVPA
jgi:hypothetical protein